jgi:hypothetical protein
MSPDDVGLLGESINVKTQAKKLEISWYRMKCCKINYMLMSYQQNVHTKLANTVNNLKM